ncbi:hypothetical protein BT63DRAFT_464583 [Microthyrium microscopicum]|uniref:Uncharacterized protein n=1 Tax=Microthyrium microscopicum TaxID=703497 RepID=A0A6A6TYH7_9PEZI|nr:hypothetical protein BT63DRAFT_464583 [Microthyrium microscopicum]
MPNNGLPLTPTSSQVSSRTPSPRPIPMVEDSGRLYPDARPTYDIPRRPVPIPDCPSNPCSHQGEAIMSRPQTSRPHTSGMRSWVSLKRNVSLRSVAAPLRRKVSDATRPLRAEAKVRAKAALQSLVYPRCAFEDVEDWDTYIGNYYRHECPKCPIQKRAAFKRLSDKEKEEDLDIERRKRHVAFLQAKVNKPDHVALPFTLECLAKALRELEVLEGKRAARRERLNPPVVNDGDIRDRLGALRD